MQITKQGELDMNAFGRINSLEPLINSEGGIHFSAYISNHFGAPSVHTQLEEALKVASEDIRSVLDRKKRKEFLEPISNLMADTKTLSSMKGNFGIFRSITFFKFLHLPIQVDEYTTVATSFHIKPLLKWIQEDRAFYLLMIENHTCRLYSATQHLLRHVDSYLPTQKSKIKSPQNLSQFSTTRGYGLANEQPSKALLWLKKILNEKSSMLRPPLFVVGTAPDHESLLDELKGQDLRPLLRSNFSDLASALDFSRAQMRKEAEQRNKLKISDFKTADALDLTESNVFKIAKAAKLGLIKRLIIASDKKIFGKILPKSGKLYIHPADIDHEDDDVLDDLAQNVIKRGGEVFITPIRNIPRNLPLLAISEPNDPTSYSQKTIQKNHYKNLITNYSLMGTRQ